MGIPNAASEHFCFVCAADCGSAALQVSWKFVAASVSTLVEVVLDIVIHNERPEHREMVGQGLVLLSVASWLACTLSLLSTVLCLQM